MTQSALRAELSRRWRSLTRALGTDREASQRVGETLLDAYSGPDRHYHGLKHLQFLFGEIDQLSGRISDHHRLELATWFHDWIYDTQRNDNEARSADTALAMLEKMRVSPDLRERVAALIRMTQSHTSSGDEDDDLFLDMDFAILGAPARIYDQYAEQVRAEFSWVPAELFDAGRAEFLRSVLARERIFLTEIYEARLGEQARENISREIDRLEG